MMAEGHGFGFPLRWWKRGFEGVSPEAVQGRFDTRQFGRGDGSGPVRDRTAIRSIGFCDSATRDGDNRCLN